MQEELDNFYLNQEEPNHSCFLALRDIILNYHPDITPAWKYKLPFFMFRNKMFCYLWKDKKTQVPYISIAKGVNIDHPDLIQGNRTYFKLLMIDPNKDIPIDTIHTIFDQALQLHGNV